MSKCISCGKRASGIYCDECHKERHPLVKGYKEPELLVCPACSKVFFRNRWQVKKLEDAIRECIAAAIIPGDNATIQKVAMEVLLEDNPARKKKLILEVPTEVHGTYQDIQCKHSEQYSLPIHIKRMTCTQCQMAGSQYFEGELQLRNSYPEAIAFAEAEIKRSDAAITKLSRHGNGYDYVLTSRRAVVKVARAIAERFGGELKLAERLVTKDRNTGKELYRVNALVALPLFKAGDVIAVGKDLVKVTGFGKRFTAINLRSGKKEPHDYSDSNDAPIPLHKAIVSKTYPHLEVIHPETYQSTKVVNSKAVTKKEVHVAIRGHELWLAD